MHPLLGYVDRWSAKPGESIRLMVSSAGDAPFEARFARIICGDPNPRGPGYREIAMPHPLAGTHPGLDQKTHLGSWARIPLLDLSGCARGLVLCATMAGSRKSTACTKPTSWSRKAESSRRRERSRLRDSSSVNCDTSMAAAAAGRAQRRQRGE